MRAVLRLAPFGYYVAITALLLWHYAQPGDAPGYDGWLYREAAATWLAGGDPWSVGNHGAHFAGAPSVFLLYAPTTLIPAEVWRPLSVVVNAAFALFALRRIGLPPYWIVYPPLAVGVLLGQPGVLMLALLVSGLAWVAPLVKPYAGLPLVMAGRWRQAALAIAAGVVSLALLPWLEWLTRLPEISARIAAELSTTVDVRQAAVGAVALAVIWTRDRKAATWLSIAALWPAWEYHYAIFALPIANPAVLLGMALVPGVWVVVAYAGWTVLARYRDRLVVGPERLAERQVMDARRPAGPPPEHAVLP